MVSLAQCPMAQQIGRACPFLYPGSLRPGARQAAALREWIQICYHTTSARVGTYWQILHTRQVRRLRPRLVEWSRLSPKPAVRLWPALTYPPATTSTSASTCSPPTSVLPRSKGTRKGLALSQGRSPARQVLLGRGEPRSACFRGCFRASAREIPMHPVRTAPVPSGGWRGRQRGLHPSRRRKRVFRQQPKPC